MWRQFPARTPSALRTDAIPASASAGAALHAAAKLVANGISRSALAVFSGRQNLL